MQPVESAIILFEFDPCIINKIGRTEKKGWNYTRKVNELTFVFAPISAFYTVLCFFYGKSVFFVSCENWRKYSKSYPKSDLVFSLF